PEPDAARLPRPQDPGRAVPENGEPLQPAPEARRRALPRAPRGRPARRERALADVSVPGGAEGADGVAQRFEATSARDIASTSRELGTSRCDIPRSWCNITCDRRDVVRSCCDIPRFAC